MQYAVRSVSLFLSLKYLNMRKFRAVCATCGSQYPTRTAPNRCSICDEERQFIGPDGQQWTTVAEVLQDHKNTWTDVEPGVIAIGIEPKFGIGQHGYLIKTGKQFSFCSFLS